MAIFPPGLKVNISKPTNSFMSNYSPSLSLSYIQMLLSIKCTSFILLLLLALVQLATSDRVEDAREKCAEAVETCDGSSELDLRDAEFEDLAKERCCETLAFLKCLREKTRPIRECRIVPGYSSRDISAAERKLRRNKCAVRGCRPQATTEAGGRRDRNRNKNSTTDKNLVLVEGTNPTGNSTEEGQKVKKHKLRQH